MDAPLVPSRCPACGAGDARTVAGAEEIRREVEALWAFHLRRLRPGTPPHHLLDRAFFSHDPPLRIAGCTACGTLYRDPAPRPERAVRGYADEVQHPHVLDALYRAQRAAYRAQARRLAALAGARGAGLEVGSYVGAFLAAVRHAGWNFTGVDVNESANRFARARGGRVLTGTIHDVDPEARFDAVAVWNCFEQLPDPRAALRAARLRLRPGGLLALRVPNGGFYARVRPALDGPLGAPARVILATNNLLGFPYRHGFTPASLRRLVEEEGFRPVRTVPDTLVPRADRWTRPWAALEARALKALLRAAARRAAPPWFELYARIPAA